MHRLFESERLKTATAVFGVAVVSAMPAFASEEAGLKARFGAGGVVDWADRTAARHDRWVPEGPFVPVVGKVDYGTAENAFGAARSGHVHAGQDMFARAGTPLVAVSDSIVVDVGADGGQGNYVHLYDRERDLTYIYMHMLEPAAVKAGDKATAGQRIGALGCTGSCYGDHLHFEIREGRGFEAKAIDPLPELRDWQSLDGPV